MVSATTNRTAPSHQVTPEMKQAALSVLTSEVAPARHHAPLSHDGTHRDANGIKGVDSAQTAHGIAMDSAVVYIQQNGQHSPAESHNDPNIVSKPDPYGNPNLPPPSVCATIPCRFYAMGTCRYGNECVFLHSPDVKPENPPAAAQQQSPQDSPSQHGQQQPAAPQMPMYYQQQPPMNQEQAGMMMHSPYAFAGYPMQPFYGYPPHQMDPRYQQHHPMPYPYMPMSPQQQQMQVQPPQMQDEHMRPQPHSPVSPTQLMPGPSPRVSPTHLAPNTPGQSPHSLQPIQELPLVAEQQQALPHAVDASAETLTSPSAQAGVLPPTISIDSDALLRQQRAQSLHTFFQTGGTPNFSASEGPRSHKAPKDRRSTVPGIPAFPASVYAKDPKSIARPPCTFFRADKADSCRNGDACQWYHIMPNGSEARAGRTVPEYILAAWREQQASGSTPLWHQPKKNYNPGVKPHRWNIGDRRDGLAQSHPAPRERVHGEEDARQKIEKLLGEARSQGVNTHGKASVEEIAASLKRSTISTKPTPLAASDFPQLKSADGVVSPSATSTKNPMESAPSFASAAAKAVALPKPGKAAGKGKAVVTPAAEIAEPVAA